MKAIAIFSGGLDSILAALLIKNSGIDVLPVFFSTPFFTPERAQQSADRNNLPLKVVDITDRYFDLLENPKYGFGGNMNPCIDCHTLMLRLAGEMLEHENASFIISGEVLGQRPMSQNKISLSIVEKQSTMKGLVLRPLSAKLLEETIPAQKGWVDEKSLLGLSGRSRKPQMALAEKLGVKDYPAPAGGCLLTDPIFSRRLKDLMENSRVLTRNEIELLKLGRHFRINKDTKIVVGRDEKENNRILSLAGKDAYTLNTVTIPGPVLYISGDRSPQMDELAASMTIAYSDASAGEHEVEIHYKGETDIFKAGVKSKGEYSRFILK